MAATDFIRTRVVQQSAAPAAGRCLSRDRKGLRNWCGPGLVGKKLSLWRFSPGDPGRQACRHERQQLDHRRRFPVEAFAGEVMSLCCGLERAVANGSIYLLAVQLCLGEDDEH